MISEIETIEQLRKNKGNKIVRARDIVFNRTAIQQKLIEIIVFPSKISKKDSLKYLDSGLNSITLRIASKNKVILGIDLDFIRNLNKKECSEEIARISQNIKLCRKCHVQLAYTSSKDNKDSVSLLKALGASTDQAARAISF